MRKIHVFFEGTKYCLLSLALILSFLVLFVISCKKDLPTTPTSSSEVVPDTGYKYYCTGNQEDVNVTMGPVFVLMGGGSDIDEAFQGMIQRSGSGSGGGDFVVIRASGTDAYNSIYLRAVNLSHRSLLPWSLSPKSSRAALLIC